MNSTAPLKMYLFLLLFTISGFSLGLADLRSDLQAVGVTALLPGDANYASSSTACERFLLICPTRLNLLSTDNLRFKFTPAAIAYPSSSTQVSAAVKVGAARNLRIVARSGGVSISALCPFAMEWQLTWDLA